MSFYDSLIITCSSFIIGALESFCEDNGKNTSRFRISKNTIKFAAGVNQFPRNFIEDLFINMANLGWSGFLDPDDNFVFISIDSLKNFPRLGTKRIRKQIEEEGND